MVIKVICCKCGRKGDFDDNHMCGHAVLFSEITYKKEKGYFCCPKCYRNWQSFFAKEIEKEYKGLFSEIFDKIFFEVFLGKRPLRPFIFR